MVSLKYEHAQKTINTLPAPKSPCTTLTVALGSFVFFVVLLLIVRPKFLKNPHDQHVNFVKLVLVAAVGAGLVYFVPSKLVGA